MSKAQGKILQSSPLFDPIKSSKQDRRDKKRKLNVAALFRKRPKMDTTDDKVKKSAASETSASTSNVDINWTPR